MTHSCRAIWLYTPKCINIPKRAACHHCIRSARVASPGSGPWGVWAACNAAEEAGEASAEPPAAMAANDAPVPTNKLRRVNCIESMVAIPLEPLSDSVNLRLIAPDASFWIVELLKCFRINFDAVPWVLRQNITTLANLHRINEVLVEVIDILRNAALQRSGNAEIVESREMLHIFTKAYPSGVGTNWNTEFLRQQDDREVFIDSAQAAAIDLANVDSFRLHQLLKHHPVMAMLAGRDSYRCHRRAYTGVAKDIVWTGRLFHPPRIEFRQFLHSIDSLANIPFLVRIQHQLIARTDFFANQPSAAKIIRGISADL